MRGEEERGGGPNPRPRRQPNRLLVGPLWHIVLMACGSDGSAAALSPPSGCCGWSAFHYSHLLDGLKHQKYQRTEPRRGVGGVGGGGGAADAPLDCFYQQNITSVKCGGLLAQQHRRLCVMCFPTGGSKPTFGCGAVLIGSRLREYSGTVFCTSAVVVSCASRDLSVF